MKAFLTILVLVIVLAVAMLFGGQNDQYVVVKYFVAQSQVRLSVLMAIMLLIGVVFSLLLFSIFWLRLKWRIRALQRRQKKSAQADLA